MSDGGMECTDCGRTHTDWSKDGRHAVSGDHHTGIIHRYECGHCGGITEVARR